MHTPRKSGYLVLAELCSTSGHFDTLHSTVCSEHISHSKNHFPNGMSPPNSGSLTCHQALALAHGFQPTFGVHASEATHRSMPNQSIIQVPTQSMPQSASSTAADKLKHPLSQDLGRACFGIWRSCFGSNAGVCPFSIRVAGGSLLPPIAFKVHQSEIKSFMSAG